MRLLLDEMLDPTIAVQLSRRDWDATAVCGDQGLEGRDDEAILRAASSAGRVLVTDNARDFSRLHADFLRAGQEHAGLIVAPPASFPRSKRTIGLWVRSLDRELLRNRSAATLANQCVWLQPVSE